MVQKFTYTFPQLKTMTIADLKNLVRKHNYVNAIRGYSSMRKDALVKALMSHSPYKKQKGGGKELKKLTEKLVPGISSKLHKEGTHKGAKKAFEKVHGKMPVSASPNKFIDLPKRRRAKPDRFKTCDMATSARKKK